LCAKHWLWSDPSNIPDVRDWFHIKLVALGHSGRVTLLNACKHRSSCRLHLGDPGSQVGNVLRIACGVATSRKQALISIHVVGGVVTIDYKVVCNSRHCGKCGSMGESEEHLWIVKFELDWTVVVIWEIAKLVCKREHRLNSVIGKINMLRPDEIEAEVHTVL
jgi:hypothetical protein